MSQTIVIETLQKGNKKCRISYDDTSMMDSPRTWSNLGVMTCHHPSYLLGDVQLTDDDVGIPRCAECEMYEDECSCKRFTPHYLKDALHVKPLYLYDHSGISISTGPNIFDVQRWDTSLVGVIYTTREKIRETYGEYIPTDKEIEDALEQEVRTYNQYLTGDVYWFEIIETIKCSSGHVHENVVDSCHDFYDMESLKETAGVAGWEIVDHV